MSILEITILPKAQDGDTKLCLFNYITMMGQIRLTSLFIEPFSEYRQNTGDVKNLLSKKMQILIADDDPVFCRVLEHTLTKYGYEVIKTNNGIEALMILQQKNAPLMAVIDWVMPEMDGIELCKKARQLFRPIPLYLIILTSKPTMEDIVVGLHSGANDYLTKPFNEKEMLARIKIGEKVVELQKNLSERINELEYSLAARKQVEGALRTSEAYRNLFKHAKDSLIVFDPESLSVLDINDKACLTYGIEREEVIGRSYPDNFQLKLEKISSLIAGETVEEFETVYCRTDGMLIYFLISLSVIEYKDQQVVLSTNRDISKQKWIEWQILRTEQEWKETVDSISDMIIIEDIHFRLKRCNSATVRFFNASFSELIGKKIRELFPFSQTGKTKIVDPLHDQSMINAWETQFPDKSDWFEITKHPLPQEIGGWVHIIKNITQRKLNELEMQRLRTGIEQAADAVSITNAEGIVQYINPSFQKITGWDKAESIGCNFLDLQGFSSSTEIYKEIMQTLAKNQVWHGDYKAHMKNGTTYYAEATISPVNNENRKIVNFVSVSRDVSEKKRFESIAEAVNMMDNVGYVFSGIRHELGNPINSIKMALSVLKNNIEQWDHDHISRYIDRSMVELGRVEYLLRSLKTFSMHENLKVQRVKILPFIEGLLSFVNIDLREKGVKLDYSIDPEVGECMADTQALHQIFLNILSNASDGVVNREDASINIVANKTTFGIEIKIIDNGIGLSEQQQANLFKPFYTSKPNGTGLGLVIVKKMMAKMNGTVEIKSQLNLGTTVILFLEAAPIE